MLFSFSIPSILSSTPQLQDAPLASPTNPTSAACSPPTSSSSPLSMTALPVSCRHSTSLLFLLVLMESVFAHGSGSTTLSEVFFYTMSWCLCIHIFISGTDQMYMTPFQCNIQNPSTYKIGTPSAPVRCDGQPSCYLYPNWGTRTSTCAKALNPMYWANLQGNNMLNPSMCPSTLFIFPL